MKKSPADKEHHPKTELDKQFLLLAERSMRIKGIATDRAMSIALDKHPDFIGRVRKGIQSATADAWETLRTKFPAPDSITHNVSTHGGGQAVGINHGQVVGRVLRLAGDDKTELVEMPGDLASAYELIIQLKSQLADKEQLIASQKDTIASKDEIISLLRGGNGRTNS